MTDAEKYKVQDEIIAELMLLMRQVNAREDVLAFDDPTRAHWRGVSDGINGAICAIMRMS